MADTFSSPNMAGYGSLASTGIQMAGQIWSAMQAQKLGRYNAEVAQINAQQDAFSLINEAQQKERLAAMLQDELAFIENVRGFEQQQLASALERQAGKLEARIGASGLGFAGSPIAALEEQARQGTIQSLIGEMQAQLQARAVTEERTQQLYGAELARFGAGQRLSIGGQQSRMATYEAGQRASAAVTKAAGTALEGYAAYNYLTAKSAAAKGP